MTAAPAWQSVRVALLTISDSRTLETDTSGAILAERITSAGHVLASRALVPDDIGEIRDTVRHWIDGGDCEVIITSGGTGLTGRDVTPEAVRPLIDKEIDGFSTIFHLVSYQSVGLSTLQSRAFAGVSGRCFVFCLPGSNGAVKDGWDKVIAPQLDSRQRPCNLVELMPRLQEE